MLFRRAGGCLAAISPQKGGKIVIDVRKTQLELLSKLFCKRDPCPTALRSCAWKRYLDIQDFCHWQCWQGQKIQGSVLPGG